MSNQYVSFISDEDLIACVAYVHEGYRNAYTDKDLKAFSKNKIDPFKAVFDQGFLGQSMAEQNKRELIRQAERTISNRLGLFHERLMGTLKGYHQLPIGNVVDVQSDNETLAVEVKNKHNTVKGSDQIHIFNTLREAIEDESNPIQEGYYVRISDTRSRMEPWVFTHKGKVQTHEGIFIASADQFYHKLTGVQDAFKQILDVLPQVIKDYKDQLPSDASCHVHSQPQTLFTDDFSHLNDQEQLVALIQENFNHYVGF